MSLIENIKQASNDFVSQNLNYDDYVKGQIAKKIIAQYPWLGDFQIELTENNKDSLFASGVGILRGDSQGFTIQFPVFYNKGALLDITLFYLPERKIMLPFTETFYNLINAVLNNTDNIGMVRAKNTLPQSLMNTVIDADYKDTASLIKLSSFSRILSCFPRYLVKGYTKTASCIAPFLLEDAYSGVKLAELRGRIKEAAGIHKLAKLREENYKKASLDFESNINRMKTAPKLLSPVFLSMAEAKENLDKAFYENLEEVTKDVVVNKQFNSKIRGTEVTPILDVVLATDSSAQVVRQQELRDELVLRLSSASVPITLKDIEENHLIIISPEMATLNDLYSINARAEIVPGYAIVDRGSHAASKQVCYGDDWDTIGQGSTLAINSAVNTLVKKIGANAFGGPALMLRRLPVSNHGSTYDLVRSFYQEDRLISFAGALASKNFVDSIFVNSACLTKAAIVESFKQLATNVPSASMAFSSSLTDRPFSFSIPVLEKGILKELNLFKPATHDDGEPRQELTKFLLTGEVPSAEDIASDAFTIRRNINGEEESWVIVRRDHFAKYIFIKGVLKKIYNGRTTSQNDGVSQEYTVIDMETLKIPDLNKFNLFTTHIDTYAEGCYLKGCTLSNKEKNLPAISIFYGATMDDFNSKTSFNKVVSALANKIFASHLAVAATTEDLGKGLETGTKAQLYKINNGKPFTPEQRPLIKITYQSPENITITLENNGEVTGAVTLKNKTNTIRALAAIGLDVESLKSLKNEIDEAQQIVKEAERLHRAEQYEDRSAKTASTTSLKIDIYRYLTTVDRANDKTAVGEGGELQPVQTVDPQVLLPQIMLILQSMQDKQTVLEKHNEERDVMLQKQLEKMQEEITSLDDIKTLLGDSSVTKAPEGQNNSMTQASSKASVSGVTPDVLQSMIDAANDPSVAAKMDFTEEEINLIKSAISGDDASAQEIGLSLEDAATLRQLASSSPTQNEDGAPTEEDLQNLAQIAMHPDEAKQQFDPTMVDALMAALNGDTSALAQLDISQEDLTKVQQMIQSNKQLGGTAPIAATQEQLIDYYEQAKRLVEAYFDPNKIDEYGLTPEDLGTVTLVLRSPDIARTKGIQGELVQAISDAYRGLTGRSVLQHSEAEFGGNGPAFTAPNLASAANGTDTKIFEEYSKPLVSTSALLDLMPRLKTSKLFFKNADAFKDMLNTLGEMLLSLQVNSAKYIDGMGEMAYKKTVNKIIKLYEDFGEAILAMYQIERN